MSVTSVAQPPEAKSARFVDHRKLGMWLFIGSEVMFFSGFIAAFVHFKVRNPGATDVLDIPLTTANSFLLLTSSFAVVSALAAIRRSDIRAVWNYLVVTWFLGLGFLMGQALEFSKLNYEGVNFHNIFGSTFFAVTGFHGFHVFLGLAAGCSDQDVSRQHCAFGTCYAGRDFWPVLAFRGCGLDLPVYHYLPDSVGVF
jgi:heme/copper-type cytochrome/quinol oxidase subunit 3